MTATCPFCALEIPAEAIVCGNCSRDIAIPPSLIAERDNLLRKRDSVQEELQKTRDELDRLRLGKRRPV
jgi:hypothetical protein